MSRWKQNKYERLVAQLGDKRWSIRMDAAVSLRKVNDSGAVDPLIKALDHKSKYVRQISAEVLENIGDKRAIDSLIRTLSDSCSGVRCWSAKALGKIGDSRALEPLSNALFDEDSHVRWWAAEALVTIGDNRNTESLIEALSDNYARVRYCSVKALGRISDHRAIKNLVKMLNDEDKTVRAEVSVAIEMIYARFTKVAFGRIKEDKDLTTFRNPDVIDLVFPLNNMSRIYIDTENYNYAQVERFITYAVNYVGKEHLKRTVEVHVHGDPEKLHLNLMNLFKHLCKRVEFHERA